MNNENHVIFKGTKDGISLLLDENCDYETIKEQLEKKVEDAAKFFDGVKTSITFKGKELTEEQESELLNIISLKTNMNIAFVKTENEKNTEPSVILSESIKQENITKFHKGAVRSGQSVEFNGSVVIIGDVNPGGIVKAEGNIIILGALKGIAHAGSAGRREAFVAALSMTPVQLRIADIITRFPDADEKPNSNIPEYAYIEDGQIYVVPLS